MRKSVIAAAVAATICGAVPATAQNYNPNTTYSNPDQYVTGVYQTSSKVCRDPWVSIAIYQVFGSVDPLHCDIRNFNNGQWNDYNQLVHAVGRYKADIDRQGLKFFPAYVNGQAKVIVGAGNTAYFLANPADFGLDVRNAARGEMVAAGGGNMVAAGGGNMVAAGGGNMVAAGAGNMVAAGGGNILGNAGSNVVVGLPPANLRTMALQGGRNIRFGSRLISGQNQ